MWKRSYRVAVLTSSDAGVAGRREDKSGPLICQMIRQVGGQIAGYVLLPDERDILRKQLLDWAESQAADLVLTTGGTGLSPRDCMPEATLDVASRVVPGISEALRMHSSQYTNRAMLSRGVSVIAQNTLIINLPGSPKAVEQNMQLLLPVLEHALDTLCGNSGDCGLES